MSNSAYFVANMPQLRMVSAIPLINNTFTDEAQTNKLSQPGILSQDGTITSAGQGVSITSSGVTTLGIYGSNQIYNGSNGNAFNSPNGLAGIGSIHTASLTPTITLSIYGYQNDSTGNFSAFLVAGNLNLSSGSISTFGTPYPFSNFYTFGAGDSISGNAIIQVTPLVTSGSTATAIISFTTNLINSITNICVVQVNTSNLTISSGSPITLTVSTGSPYFVLPVNTTTSPYNFVIAYIVGSLVTTELFSVSSTTVSKTGNTGTPTTPQSLSTSTVTGTITTFNAITVSSNYIAAFYLNAASPVNNIYAILASVNLTTGALTKSTETSIVTDFIGNTTNSGLVSVAGAIIDTSRLLVSMTTSSTGNRYLRIVGISLTPTPSIISLGSPYVPSVEKTFSGPDRLIIPNTTNAIIYDTGDVNTALFMITYTGTIISSNTSSLNPMAPLLLQDQTQSSVSIQNNGSIALQLISYSGNSYLLSSYFTTDSIRSFGRLGSGLETAVSKINTNNSTNFIDPSYVKGSYYIGMCKSVAGSSVTLAGYGSIVNITNTIVPGTYYTFDQNGSLYSIANPTYACAIGISNNQIMLIGKANRV